MLHTRCPDRFTIELCAEAAPLCHSLLASPAAVHHQAARGMLDAMLGRWGDSMRGALRCAIGCFRGPGLRALGQLRQMLEAVVAASASPL